MYYFFSCPTTNILLISNWEKILNFITLLIYIIIVYCITISKVASRINLWFTRFWKRNFDWNKFYYDEKWFIQLKMQDYTPISKWFQENSPLLLTWLCGVISATVLIFVVPGWHPGLGQNSEIRSHRMGAWDSDIIWHLYITLSSIKYNWSALQTGLSRCHEVCN